MKPVLIFGAGHLGKIALDILQKNKLFIYGLLDDDLNLKGKIIQDIPVLGTTQEDQFMELLNEKCAAFVALKKAAARKLLIEKLKKTKNAHLINAIHPSVILASDIHLGEGNLINAATSLGPEVTLGNGCILASHCGIGQDTKIGNYVHIGAGSMIAERVVIESEAYIGSGAIILAEAHIPQGAYIKPGSIVEKK
ncbi:MAG: acetyltransferase [Bacteroidota bacterium]